MAGETLEATLQGVNRADLTVRAQKLATAFFDTECVAVVLTGPTTIEGDADAPVFTSSFVAQEHHPVEARNYGPAECRKCGRKSWPSDPLPRADI